MANTALNRTTQALLTNKSGGALVYGDVVVLDNTNSNGFTTTTTAGLSTRGLGVILEPSGIANNASGMVAIGGWVPQINLNTAATVGQFIKTHTVAGQGTPHSSPQVEGDFAVALTASATPPAMLFGSANGPGGSAGTVTNTGTLTQYAVIIGNGGVDVTALASLGSSGDVLTSAGAGVAPSFQAPAAGGGGLVLLEQHTASASATLDFTTAITSTYDTYQIEGVDLVAATNGDSLLMRVGTGVGPTYDTGANYAWQRNYNIMATNFGFTGSANATGATSMTVMVLVSSTNPTYFSMTVKSPTNASYKKLFHWWGQQIASDSNLYQNDLAGGYYTPTTALTALQFLMSTGNIASGTIRIYGVAK